MKYDFSHWDKLPKVSCLCPTYGRANIIHEAVMSFILQDYPGEKELIILNDLEGCPLELSQPHKDIRIINTDTRYPNLGDKRNATAGFSTGDVLMSWDDDDIYLPNRISTSIERMKNKHYFKPLNYWWYAKGGLEMRTIPPRWTTFNGSAAYSRELFEQVGGYPDMHSGQDQKLDAKFIKTGLYADGPLTPEETFFIYRLNGVKTYHLSTFGMGKGHEEVKTWVEKNSPKGKFIIYPKWDKDYIEMTKIGKR